MSGINQENVVQEHFKAIQCHVKQYLAEEYQSVNWYIFDQLLITDSIKATN